MEHLLQKSKCCIFHNIFKYMIFQRRQKELLWSKWLISHHTCKRFNTCDNLQDFANQAESIFRGSERHTDLDKAYSRLVRTIFDNINRISEDHPKTPREVIMMGRPNTVFVSYKIGISPK